MNLFLGDLTRPSLDVRFRLKIIGQSVTLETKPEFIPPRVTLESGVNMRLISSDLAAYFDTRNLNFTGITEAQYERTGKLPEGVYQFCFEVLEYNRGVRISNTACGVAWMILNDPPLINLPRQNEKLRPQDPQNIVLQWTPRHTGSPNSAFNTDYELTMVEVWPGDRDPNDAILSSPPILQATTRSTTYIYGPSEVPLEAGRRYAFRVKAKAISGIDELDLFKNNGYSEVYTFTYGDACGIASDIAAEALSSSKIKITWSALSRHTTFNVRYRQQGTTDWYINNSVLPENVIYSLKPSSIYEYQVSGMCGSVNGEYSEVASIKTPEAPPLDYSCNLPIEIFNLDPSKLTGSLKTGDIVNAGDFDVEITKVSGSGGTFSGEGVVVMPMMNKVSVKVEFSSITVATDDIAGVYRMVKGVMNVTGGKVEVIPAGVMNLVEKLDDGLNAIDSALTIVETYLPRTGPDPSSFAADTLIAIDGDILTVVPNNAKGTVYVTTKDGKVTELPAGGAYAVTDKSGKGYVVNKDGSLTRTTAEEAEKASKRSYNLSMQFKKSPTSKYGFDAYDGNEPLGFTYEILNETYYVPWKAVELTTPDMVEAELSDATLNAGNVRFEMIGLSGTAVHLGNNRWNIQITSANTTAKIIAYYKTSDDEKEQILGKLNVAGFAKEDYTLVIVNDINSGVPAPDDATLSAITTHLNDVYGQAAVNWKVTVQSRDLGTNKNFDAGGTSILTNYTADMRQVISRWGELQEKTYYMFVIPKPDNSGNVQAVMPRSRQAGFVYSSGGSLTTYMHAVAHELGHGAFSLRHPFLEFNGLAQGATNNLMDYTSNEAEHLMHFQWERIHDPVVVIGLFDGDEEAEYKNDNPFRDLSDSWSFFTPTSDAIQIPGISKGKFTNNGTLEIFYANKVLYGAVYFGHTFKGYAAIEDIKNAQFSSGDFVTESADAKLNQILFRGYKTAEVGSVVYASVRERVGDVLTNCYCDYFCDNTSKAGDIEGTVSSPIALLFNAMKTGCSGTQCQDIEGLYNGAGAIVYIALMNKVEPSMRPLLMELANHLTLAIEDKTFAFYGYGLEKNIFYKEFSRNILTFFNNKKIYSIAEFQKYFQVEYNTFSRDYGIIFSNIDLRNNIPDNYNVKSYDYVRKTAPYEYSFQDLIARKKLQEVGGVHFYIVEENERKQEAEPISIDDGYRQYVAKYNTNSALFFIAEWSARMSEDVIKAYLAYMMIAVYPAQATRDAVVGAMLDYALQVVINWAFLAEDGTPFSELAKNVDFAQIAASAVENSFTASIVNKKVEMVVSGAANCIFDGTFENGELRKEGFDAQTCMISFASAIIVSKVSNFAFDKVKTLDVERIKKGLRKIGIDESKWDDILDWWLGPGRRGSDKVDDVEEAGEIGVGKIVTRFDDIFAILKKKGLPDDLADVVARRSEVLKLADNVIEDLANDLAGSSELRRVILENVDLIDSWKVFMDANLSDAIRKNPSNLESLSKALKQNGYSSAYFENLLKSKNDPQKFIDDYLSKLGNDGKFVDNALESNYESYVSRKDKEGKPPRDRGDWNEASDYMKYNSPTVRGNNFNKKAWDEEWYPYWEVYLDNGKYLDGYNPLTKEVVSRKATDLIDISEATFVKHLDEILEKYAPPRIIKSKKPGYDNLFDKPLPSDAKLILEIPESNKTFFDIDRYISIAEKKGITLKFKPE